jgi:hypothetical protein
MTLRPVARLEEPFKRDYTVDGASEETVARHARRTAGLRTFSTTTQSPYSHRRVY